MGAGRFMAALVLILLGLAFLAGNLGLLEWDYLFVVWQLWPLLLVVIGISLFFGRGRRWLAIVLIILVVLAGIALVVLAPRGTGSSRIQEESFAGPPARGTQSAQLIAKLGALDLEISGRGSGAIIEADYRVRGDLVVADTGPSDRYEVEFSQESRGFVIPFVGEGGRQFCRLGLAPDVPWDISLDVGAASADIDLTDVTLQALEIDAGASSLDLRLGEQIEDGATVRIDGGAGSFDIAVPSSLNVTVVTDTGLSSENFDDAFEQRGDERVHEGGGPELRIELKTGASSLDVELY